MHARDMHQNQLSLNNFSVAVVKKVSPQQLRREEFRFIDKYKTLSLGLNRYKVLKRFTELRVYAFFLVVSRCSKLAFLFLGNYLRCHHVSDEDLIGN